MLKGENWLFLKQGVGFVKGTKSIEARAGVFSSWMHNAHKDGLQACACTGFG